MLYKYIKKEHLDAFFKSGKLKIGTLYEYRNEEELGYIIGDNKEGVHITELNSPKRREIDLASNSPEASYFKRHVLRPDQQDSKVKIIMEAGANLIAHTNAPNYYIYCVTTEYDKEMMKQFGCDSCIEILDPERFFKVISKAIKRQGSYQGYFKISYGNKTTDYLHPHKVPPALLKDVKYVKQAEVRAIWVPNKDPKGSIFVNVSKAIKYCREYKP